MSKQTHRIPNKQWTGLNGWIGYIFAIGFILYLLRYPILFIISLFY